MLNEEGHAQCWAPRAVREVLRNAATVTRVEINAWAEEGTERAAQDKWERKSDSHCHHAESHLGSLGLHGACRPSHGKDLMES